jgi:hypothetical protein
MSLYKHLQRNGNIKRTIPRIQHNGPCRHTANLCATDPRIDLCASPNTNYWTQCQPRPTECLRHKPSNVRFHWPHHILFGSPRKHIKTGAISKEVITEATCNKQCCRHVDINQIWQPSQRYVKQILYRRHTVANCESEDGDTKQKSCCVPNGERWFVRT